MGGSNNREGMGGEKAKDGTKVLKLEKSRLCGGSVPPGLGSQLCRFLPLVK